MLVDELGLQFDHVSTELDRLIDTDPGWWALGKLLAYSLQDRPFVHIDSDVFLWKPLPASLTCAPVFTQCPEHHPFENEWWCGPRDVERLFERHNLHLPVEWRWSSSRSARAFRAENCGILGANRVDFVRYYAQTALRLVNGPANAEAWAEAPDKRGFNAVIEQFFLAACVDYHPSIRNRTIAASPCAIFFRAGPRRIIPTPPPAPATPTCWAATPRPIRA